MGDDAKAATDRVEPMNVGQSSDDATKPVAETTAAVAGESPVPPPPVDSSKPPAEKVSGTKELSAAEKSSGDSAPTSAEAVTLAGVAATTPEIQTIAVKLPVTPKESREEKAIKRREKALAKLQAQLAAEPEPRVRSCRNAAKIAQTKIAESAKILNSNKMEEEEEDEKPAPPVAIAKSPKGLKHTMSSPLPPGTTLSHHHKGVSILTRQPGGGHVSLPKMPILVFKPLAQPNQPGRPQPSVQILTTKAGVKLTGISQTGPRVIMTKPGTRLGFTTSGMKPLVPGSGLKPGVTLVQPGASGTKMLLTGTSNKQMVLKPAMVKPTLRAAAPVLAKRAGSLAAKLTAPRPNDENEPGLSMECEDDDLSPIQWSTYKKAENDYLACLRKLTRLNSQPEVKIVHLGADDPSPPVPRFLSVQEASRLPPPMVTTKGGDSSADSSADAASTPAGTRTRPLGSVLKFATPQAMSNQQKATVMARGSSSAPPKAGPSHATAPTVQKQQSTSPGGAPEKVYFTTYPELEVTFVPQELLPSGSVFGSRESLDKYMKTLLASGDLNIEKWMLEKGLFGATRFCLFHSTVQMKLMYMSCISKSQTQRKSGYKWWCPNCAVMVPVVQGSFFARFKEYSHAEVLEQVRRWACNEVERDKTQLMRKGAGDMRHSVYEALRSVCNSQAARWKLGGSGHSVEVAMASVSACLDASDIGLYCAYDRTTRCVKLGVGARGLVLDERLSALFETGVDADSTIVGARQLMPRLPPHFFDSFVVSSSCANLNASAYLRNNVLPAVARHLPRLDQTVLQSLLDELSWREKFGRTSQCAFTNILTHIKQTYLCSVVSTQGGNAMPIATSAAAKITEAAKSVSAGLGNQKIVLPLPPLVSCKPVAKPVPVPSTAALARTTPELIELESDSDSPEKPGPLKPSTQLKRLNFNDVYPPAKRPLIKQLQFGGDRLGATVASTKKGLKDSEDCGLVSLASYYYGTLEGDTVGQSGAERKRLKFKCPVCKKGIEENIKMMKHLHGHIDDIKQFNLDLDDLTQCKLCFREFPSPFAVQSHMEEVHRKNPKSLVCRICDKEFDQRILLISHMSQFHVPSDMPYKCHICRFRTSFYRDAVDHFRQVHNQSEKLLCQFCLQVYGNTHSFFRHLQYHRSKRNNRRCSSCCLAFVSKGDLTAHKKDSHMSMKDVIGVKPYVLGEGQSVIMIDLATLGKPMMMMRKMKEMSPRVVRTTNEIKCIECNTSLYRSNHFAKIMRCPLCRFETHCSQAYSVHAANSHAGVERHGTVAERPLPEPVLCICGFASYYGNKMARHLSNCSRKWCYLENDDPYSGVEMLETCELAEEQASDEDDYVAAEACMELDDEGTPMAPENEDKHNMLNILGLMRVAPNVRRRSSSTAKPVSSDNVDGTDESASTSAADEDSIQQVNLLPAGEMESESLVSVDPTTQPDIQFSADVPIPKSDVEPARLGSPLPAADSDLTVAADECAVDFDSSVLDVQLTIGDARSVSMEDHYNSELPDQVLEDTVRAAPLDVQLPAGDVGPSVDILLGDGEMDTLAGDVNLPESEKNEAALDTKVCATTISSASLDVQSPVDDQQAAPLDVRLPGGDDGVASLVLSRTDSVPPDIQAPVSEADSAPLDVQLPPDEKCATPMDVQLPIADAVAPAGIQLPSADAVAPMDIQLPAEDIDTDLVAALDTASLDIQLIGDDSEIAPMDIDLPIEGVEALLPKSGPLDEVAL